MQPPSSSSLLMLCLASTAASYILPNPPGQYNVTLTTGPLVDYSRDGRALMLSVFQPANCNSTHPVPYMPNKTAKYQGPFLKAVFDLDFNASPLFAQAHLPVCPDNSNDNGHPKDHGCERVEGVPILLFQPGYSIPRLYYSYLASAIASQGFTVITIDSPGDANIVVYPDGEAIYNKDTSQTTESITRPLPDQVKDISFVIDQLSNGTAMGSLIPHRRAHPFPTNRVASFGHSLGGVAAVVAASRDPRIRGAINWDGSFLDKPLQGSSVAQPVLLMSHGNADETWPATWPLLKGEKLWVNIANTTHESFADTATLVEASGLDDPSLADVLGTIEPEEMVKILVAYTTQWMRGVFAGKINGPLLTERQPRKFPEVEVLRQKDL